MIPFLFGGNRPIFRGKLLILGQCNPKKRFSEEKGNKFAMKSSYNKFYLNMLDKSNGTSYHSQRCHQE